MTRNDANSRATGPSDRAPANDPSAANDASASVDAWLAAAVADAERRGLPELKPMLETLANATRALRKANFSGSAR
jgi:hypothetical protein